MLSSTAWRAGCNPAASFLAQNGSVFSAHYLPIFPDVRRERLAPEKEWEPSHSFIQRGLVYHATALTRTPAMRW